MREKVIVCTSAGKDSTFALFKILKDKKYEVITLLTTVTKNYDRISMHGVRRVLLEQYAESLGLPLEIILISKKADNVQYEQRMNAVLKKYQKQGVNSVVFGDLFLEGIRAYREKNLAKIGMKGLFPLWGMDTKKLANQFIKLGFKAVISCVDPKQIDKSFAGRFFDKQFLKDLPKTADPCGEKGEFHSFVFDGPIFKRKISLKKGKIVERAGFWFCDLIPA